jgi:hypothetical protein
VVRSSAASDVYKRQVQGKILSCEHGANLRKVLLKHDINLSNEQ